MTLGIGSILGIIFVVLKLAGITAIASWSWIWVLAPFWIGFALWFVFAFLVLTFVDWGTNSR